MATNLIEMREEANVTVCGAIVVAGPEDEGRIGGDEGCSGR